MLELARRAMAEQLREREVFSTPDAVKHYLQLHLARRQHEIFAVLFLDSQNRLIGLEELFRGTLTQTSVYPREVVLRALHHHAAAVVLAHNHPSGTVSPSRADEAQPDDPVPGHEISLAGISPRLFEAVEIDLGVRIWPQLQTQWPYIDYHGLRDVFVIKYEMGVQENLRMHHDVAQVSASMKLNDGYEGAILDFPRQGATNESAEVGELVVFPSLVTHPHQATPLRSGVKYGLVVWFELPTF